MPVRDPDELHGIHAVVYALFDEGGQLDRDAMLSQVEVCLAAGVHGMAALGLATEVTKLAEGERLSLMEWVAEANAGRVPLAITVSGSSVGEQTRQARHAERCGADWLILQPPPIGQCSVSECLDFHCAVAGATDLPIAIQNAPAFFGRELTIDDIVVLRDRCPNFRLIKAEGSAVETAALIERTGGSLPVFNGRAGMELVDNLDIGCRGLILAPDCIDHAVSAYNRHREGDVEGANSIYRRIAPAIIFEMQGIETLVCYGKRLFGERAGFRIFDRSPALRPSEAGLRLVRKHAAELGPLNDMRSRGGLA